MARTVARGRALDRVDRTRNPPRALDRRLLGEQARAHLAARATASSEGPDSPRAPRGARRGRPLDPRDRSRARPQRYGGPPLAQEVRPQDPAVTIRSRRQRVVGDARMRSARLDGVRADRARRSVPLRPLQRRGGRRTAAPREGDARRRVRRRVPALRLRPLRRRAPVPSPRSGRKAVPARRTRAHAVARRAARGGPQVRAAVRELPCDGRSRSRYPAAGPTMACCCPRG
jgi:hypothetical protein